MSDFECITCRDPRTVDYWPISSPTTVITALASYVVFVKFIGPRMMRNRKPVNVDKYMIAYNIVQCLSNAVFCIMVFPLLFHEKYSFFCETTKIKEKSLEKTAILGVYFYCLLKYLDLVDTIFMVLKKNFHQVTFLHLYHHLLMAGGTSIGFNYFPSAHFLVIGVCNTAVHTIMYFYYLLTVLKPERKTSLWWKKHITQIQMLQHFIIGFHSSLSLFNPHCGYSRILSSMFFLQAVHMLYMFGDFYYTAYIKPKPKQT